MNDNRKLINIRVTEKEKAQLDRLAQKCGLSLSEYLRKRGLGYEPGPFLDDRFYTVYTKLCEISNFPLKPEAEAALTAIFNDLQQNLFLPRKQTQREITEEVNGERKIPGVLSLCRLRRKRRTEGDLTWLQQDSGL